MLHHFITNIPKIAKIFWQKLPVPRAAALDLWNPETSPEIATGTPILIYEYINHKINSRTRLKGLLRVRDEAPQGFIRALFND